MGASSEKTEPLAAIRDALATGTDVEDLMEQMIPRAPDPGDGSGLVAKLRSLGQGGVAQGGAESIRRIADGLDQFAADMAWAAIVLEDEELTALGEQAGGWGRALWESEIGVDRAYNHLRQALVELCRRRASVLTGRELGSLR